MDRLRGIKGPQIEHAELVLGQPWNADGFVFCGADGAPHDSEVVTKNFSHRAKAAGLGGFTLHSARHTHASLMLAVDENNKVVH